MAASESARLEAVLFAEGGPVSRKRLASVLGMNDGALTLALEDLRHALSGRGLALVEVKDEVELRTSPDVSDAIEKLREGELSRDLGKAGLETLAIVLYQGGATRSEIDWVRGVNSAQTVRSLLLRGLVKKTEDPGDRRKYRYEVTTEALSHLGVGRIEDLPRFAELRAEAKEAIAAAASEE